jgi:hypothetical protein
MGILDWELFFRFSVVPRLLFYHFLMELQKMPVQRFLFLDGFIGMFRGLAISFPRSCMRIRIIHEFTLARSASKGW